MKMNNNSICKTSRMIGFNVIFGLLACALLASAFEAEVDGDNYVVGGRNANPGQFPWLVSLRTTQNQHFCGAFVLSNRWIGTAAHCTQGRLANPNAIIAVTAAHTRTDGTRHPLARVVNHPRYNRQTLLFDVSVVQTTENIVFNQRVRVINFPTGAVVHNNAAVFLAGWGLTAHPSRPGQGLPAVLQWKPTRTIPREQCMQRHGQRARMIHPETVCTLNPDGKGACMGDSGGPLVTAQGVCIGVVSWGIACARGFPDVYAKLWTAIPFIRQVSAGQIPNLPQGPQ